MAQLGRRQARPAPRHPVQHADQERALRRGVRALDPDDRQRPDDRHAVPGHLLRHAVGTADRPVSRAGQLQGQAVLHRACSRRTPVDLAGKRVGVVGNGATGIQVIQTVANQADHLTVFVRTPQYVLPMKNPKYTPADQEAYKARFKELTETLPHTFTGFEYDFENKWADLTPAQRRKVLEDIYEDGSLKLWLASFGEMFFDADVSEQISEFVREKMRERLQGPAAVRHPDPEGLRLRHASCAAGDGLSGGVPPPQRRARQRQGQPDRAHHAGRPAAARRHGAQVRHPDLRNRLRCGNRRADTDGHPWPRRALADRGVGPRHPHHDGTADPRLSEPVHHRHAARSVRGAVQHDHLPATAGRVDQRLHQVHARRTA